MQVFSLHGYVDKLEAKAKELDASAEAFKNVERPTVKQMLEATFDKGAASGLYMALNQLREHVEGVH